MKKLLVAVLTCIGVAYAYGQSQYPFTGADTTTYYPEVFKCITSSPGLICPGFVPTDVTGNPLYGGNLGLGATGSAPPTTASYMGVTSGGNLQGWDRSVIFDPTAISRVLPQTAGQWGLGATGSAAPTTAMNMGVTSAGNLQAWDRSVKEAPEAAWNVFVPGGVNPTTANQWGLGPTTAAPPTTAMYLAALARSTEQAATSGGNLTGLLVDLIGRLVNVPYAPREQALQGGASTNGSLGLILIPAQGPNVKIYVTAVQCGRDDAGTTAINLTLGDIKGTPMVLPNSGGGGGNNATYPIPLVVTANTNFVTTPSAAVSFLRCSAQGYTGY